MVTKKLDICENEMVFVKHISRYCWKIDTYRISTKINVLLFVFIH